jgi:alpha-beta hydrolase superfamily lysophospholipase
MMTKQISSYASQRDGQILSITEFNHEHPKAVVLIVHGMVEHQDRYDKFRHALLHEQFSSVAFDVRGHGRSLFNGSIKGHYADQDAWSYVIDDLHHIIEFIKTKSKQPLILFGHSLGSVMVRSYLNHYPHDQIKGVMLSGSPSYNPAISMAIPILKGYMRFRQSDSASPLLSNALFLPYQKTIKQARTAWDWLSYNEHNVDSYIADELCGFPFTLGSLEGMFMGLKDVYHDTHRIQEHGVPIHFISGVDDPCHQPKGIEAAVKRMQQLGYQNVSMQYVPKARHEILQEDHASETIKDIIELFETWIVNN